MEEKVGLVFSWDPKARAWVKERGPEDAAPPPAEPIDDGAVQTYFLDPTNGRWQPTILGLRARQIANDLGNVYRTAAVPGLAMVEVAQRNPRLVVEREGEYKGDAHRRGALRMVGALLVLVVLIGGGAVAANSFFGPLAAVADATPTGFGATKTAGAPGSRLAATSPAATETAAATDSNEPAPTNAPATAPTRTAPQTVAPVTLVSYSTRLANGTVLTYNGPNAVVRENAIYMTFRATQPNGQPAFDNLTVYLGPLGTAQAVTIQADTTGLYTVGMKVTLPRGDQLLSVQFGRNAEIRTLGTISVR